MRELEQIKKERLAQKEKEVRGLLLMGGLCLGGR
jgi:hypothetical protein